MKRFTVIITVLLVAFFVVSCGGKVEPVGTNKSTDNTTNQSTESKNTNQNQRELQEAPDQPALWVACETFMKAEKVLDASVSLKKNMTTSKQWKIIEEERRTWAQNPQNELTEDDIKYVYETFVVGTSGFQPSTVINYFIYRGADLDDLNTLHMLKDNPDDFTKKFEEIYLK
ncbi:MAG: hypothetical protein R2883_06275 [Caldisericia bacterium]